MGANLSSTLEPDTSKVVLSAPDAFSDMLLGVIWLLVLHVCAVIFSTCTLVDRWKGSLDNKRIGGGSILAALLLSTAWPVVMLYLILAG